MKKLSNLAAAALIGAALLFASNVKAQTTPANAVRLGIGVDAGIPTGRASNSSNFELGGTARLQYGLSNNFALTLTSGYYDLMGKNNPRTGNDYNGFQIVPVKIGVKEFFASNLYVGAEAGAGFVTTVGGHTKLDLSPTLGYANTHWDVGVHYDNFSGQGFSYGLLGLRLAYGFGL
jgi:hypothetical protein